MDVVSRAFGWGRSIIAALAVLVAVGWWATSAAAALGWAVQRAPSPMGASEASLSAVSCSSSTDCLAVGQSAAAQSVVAHWDGARWSIQPTRLPAGRSNAGLNGVSCASQSACTAVGWSSSSVITGTLVERWNGRRWSIQQAPSPNTSAYSTTLSGVSCSSPSACTAVGGYYLPGAEWQVVFAERWDGVGWSIEPIPEPAGAAGGELSGVSCSSPNACTAVGDYVTASHPGHSSQVRTLIERWNGTSWSMQTGAEPVGVTSSGFSAVSCSSATACTAVGLYLVPSKGWLTLVEGWDGTSWRLERSVTPAGFNVGSNLSGVSCTSRTACTLVGESGGRALVERWRPAAGGGWSIAPAPSPPHGTSGALNGVSCLTPASCTAVGSFESFAGGFPLLTRWNGTSWSIERLPNRANGNLQKVSCSAPAACTAVGSYVRPDSTQGALAERWNGKRWSIQLTPLPAGGSNASLTGVSCPSQSACTAVGSYDAGGRVLVEHWNGARWSIQQAPTPSGGGSLTSVSCTSPTFCLTVGLIGGGYGVPAKPLAERWNGRKWSIQQKPSPSAPTSVSCVSPTACTAVARYDVGEPVLVARWNGSRWTAQHAPTPQGSGAELSDVSCISVTACTAIGSGARGALAEHWNGTHWTIQPTPSPPGVILEGVSCPTTSACTTTGSDSNGALAERWNGKHWTIQSTPGPTGRLPAVSCATTTTCIAVGNYQDAIGQQRVLIERWTGTS